MNTLLPFADFVWILQKEEYETGRYFLWLRRFFFRRNFVISEKLVHTLRAAITLAFAKVLWLAAAFALIFGSFGLGAKIIGLIFTLLLVPVFVLVANALLTPLFAFAHARVRQQARAKVAHHAPMTIVAIVGSYGKTTSKHFLYELARYQYRAQMTPGTVNTTTGIAAWLLKELAPATELLILEMDAYHAGEIAESCRMAPPDIVVVTNIGEQHLARFGTHEGLRRALGEAVAGAKADALILADAPTTEQVRPWLGGRTSRVVDTTRLRYGEHELAAPLLSASNRENLARVLAGAEHLDIPEALVADTISHLAMPERRQKPIELYGYEAIDDSYNISLSTARAGLAAARTLAAARGKKLLVVAAGIPELGPEEQEGNVELGRAIAEVADHAIVLGTMYAEDIEKGLAAAPHTRYRRLADFVADSAKFPSAEWVLLLEPVLPDLYY